ncbi:conserved hypothetical protein [Pediculus humanus corporis]|uniref:Uncharacterized protein n=1 Tax=Pediculus humanus subsp. corporis TaxID=121224 RepID=E0VRV7_PEDHC|nr:uncharacterized protein Phum_PHUM405160 [Pediculus humanus corporis]EEB16113.1 conserved hypothetical protein [Pediculus humanus corporis]
MTQFYWPVNPDAGLYRRREYEAVNGRHGYRHTERIGLGEDGHTEERRIQQKIRDEIGALSYQPPIFV